MHKILFLIFFPIVLFTSLSEQESLQAWVGTPYYVKLESKFNYQVPTISSNLFTA